MNELAEAEIFSQPMSDTVLTLVQSGMEARLSSPSQVAYDLVAPENMVALLDMKPDSHTYDLLTIKVQGEKGTNRTLSIQIEDTDSTPRMINTHNDEFGSRLNQVTIRELSDSRHVMLENNIIVERTFTHKQPDNNYRRVRDASDFKTEITEETTVIKPVDSDKPIRIHGQALTVDYRVDGDDVNLEPNAIVYELRDGNWKKSYVYIGGDDAQIHWPTEIGYSDNQGGYDVYGAALEDEENVQMVTIMKQVKLGEADHSVTDLVSRVVDNVPQQSN